MLTPNEMLLLRDSGSAVAMNPVASPWKGNAVSTAELLAALGVRLGMGTDGTRSDGFRMMDAAESNRAGWPSAWPVVTRSAAAGASGWTWPHAAVLMPRAWAR